TANGNVEAKVVCLFRRRDISGNLNTLADSNAKDFEEESKQPTVSEQQKHQLKHRELFLSRQFESLPATHIRRMSWRATWRKRPGCVGQMLERGRQLSVDDEETPSENQDTRIQEKMETKVWDPDNQLKDPQIDQFLVVARAVGTFARALDCSSSIRQPSLHMSAAAASRDITLFHAMDTLQKNEYDLARAMSTLVPQGGPVLCRDEMEEWSASEAMLFEEALEKYGKDFNDIRQDFLPWKSLASVVQFYYMWKTTDRYIQQKRLKAAEADSKLKQVYIPTYTKPNPNQIMAPGSKPGMNGAPAGFQKGLSCESCHTAQSPQWYAWGPPNMQCRLCASCWIYWKKYGGLKTPTQLEGAARAGSESGAPRGHMTRQEAQGLSPFTRNEGRAKLLAKNRQTFILQTTKLTRIARRVCQDILQPRRAARRPYASVNANAVKAECIIRLPKATKNPQKNRVIPRQSLATIVKDLGKSWCCSFSSPLPKPITAPLKLKAPRGLPPPINRNQTSQPRGGPGLLGKRPFDNQASGGVPFSTNGRPFTSGLRTTSQSVIKRQKVNQGDAPNPVVFVATKDTRALRKHLSQSEMRRAARKPHLPTSSDDLFLPPHHEEMVDNLLSNEDADGDPAGLSLAEALLPLAEALSPPQVPWVCSTRYKTELCTSYASSGLCKYAERCQFAHGLPELHVPYRHPKYKTEACRSFHTTGACYYGARCLFVHGAAEQRPAGRQRRKNVPCRTFSSFGVCPFGTRCNFLHWEELGPGGGGGGGGVVVGGAAESPVSCGGSSSSSVSGTEEKEKHHQGDLLSPVFQTPASKERRPRGALCRTFTAFGFCLYGTRCHFQHDLPSKVRGSSESSLSPAGFQAVVGSWASSRSSSSSAAHADVPPLSSPFSSPWSAASSDSSPSTSPLATPPAEAHNAFTFSSQHLLSGLVLPLALAHLQQLERSQALASSARKIWDNRAL
ncbi:hypothetical protein NHX12_014049, partial [Muraenolepis orangiensis]